jgi:hypothetical protein
MLTTLPPVDGSGSLLVLPYLLCLLVGAGGYTSARRAGSPVVALVAPVLLLAAVILLGVEKPGDPVGYGTAFAAVALAWAGIRAGRLRPVAQNKNSRRSRRLIAASLVTVATAVAALGGGGLPGTSGGKRVVLRSYVTAPFDVGQYPSPLAGFRKYTPNSVVAYNKNVMFTVANLPASVKYIRIATMTDYDASTWRVNDDRSDKTDVFQRVGSSIPATSTGHAVNLTVTVGPYYNDVWVPTVGDTVSIHFEGVRADSHAKDFRYDLDTGTGLEADRLSPGDSYKLKAVLPTSPVLGSGVSVAVGQPGVDPATSAFVKAGLDRWLGAGSTSSNPLDTLLAVTSYLKNKGGFTHGEKPYGVYTSGHNVKRLTAFLNQPAGDDEQYAALVALVANYLGMDARVVLGATPEAGGVVKGADIHAWVEVATTQPGVWATLRDFLPIDPPQQPTPPQQTDLPRSIVPPPAGGRPPSALLNSDNTDQTQQPHPPNPTKGGGFHLPGLIVTGLVFGGPPISLIAVLCVLIVVMKTVRRRRRRTNGTVTSRVALGWRELLDYARDLGDVVPAGLTRREQATALCGHDLEPLAADADGQIFGPGEPTEAVASGYWSEVDAARRRMARSVGRWKRLRAAVSLKSLSLSPAQFRSEGT